MCSRRNASTRSPPQCPETSCPLNTGFPRQVPLAESWCPAGYRLACPACYTEVVPCEACDALVPVPREIRQPESNSNGRKPRRTHCPCCGFRCFIDTLERAVCGLSPSYPLSSDDVIAVQTSKQTDIKTYLNAKLRQLDELEKQLRQMDGTGNCPPNTSTTAPQVRQNKSKERSNASKKSKKGKKPMPSNQQPGAAPTPGATVATDYVNETDLDTELHRKRKRLDRTNEETNRLNDPENDPINEGSESNSSKVNKRRRLNEMENRVDPTNSGLETSEPNQNVESPKNQTAPQTAKSRGGGGKRKKARIKARKALQRSSPTPHEENNATDPSLTRPPSDVLPKPPLDLGAGDGVPNQISESQLGESCTLGVSAKDNDPNFVPKRNMLNAKICECRRQIALLCDGEEVSLRISLWSRTEKGISDCTGDVVSYSSSFGETKLALLRTIYSLEEENTDDVMNMDNEDINAILSLIPKFQSMLPLLMATKMSTKQPCSGREGAKGLPKKQNSFPAKLLSERSETLVTTTSGSRPCPTLVRSKSLPSTDAIRAAAEPTLESESECGMQIANNLSSRPVSILWKRLLELVGREMDRVYAVLLEESGNPVDGGGHTGEEIESGQRRMGVSAFGGDNLDDEDPDEEHNETQKSTSTPGSIRCLGLQRFKECHLSRPTTAASLLQSIGNGNVRTRQLEKIRLFRCLYRSVITMVV